MYVLDLTTTTTTTVTLALRTHAHAILRSFFSSNPPSRFYGIADVTNRPINAASSYSYPSSSTLTTRPQWLALDKRSESPSAAALFASLDLIADSPQHHCPILDEVQRAHKYRQVLSQAKAAGRVLLRACTQVFYTQHHPMHHRPMTLHKSTLQTHSSQAACPGTASSTTAHHRASVPNLSHPVVHPAQA